MTPNIIDTLLTSLEPTLVELVDEKIVKENIQRFSENLKPLTVTPYLLKLFKLELSYDIVKSFAKYTKPSDVLEEDYIIRKSKKGSLMILAGIYRNDVRYWLETELIMASGVVQCLHYRVLTKTNLPKETENCENKVAELKQKIKAMNDSEKLLREEKDQLGYIARYESLVSEASALNDEEILNKRHSIDCLTPYEDLREDYEYWEQGKLLFTKSSSSKEDYEKLDSKIKTDFIKNYRRMNITVNNSRIKDCEKQLTKIRTKLQQAKSLL